MQQIQEYDRMKIAMLNVDLRKDDEEKKLILTFSSLWNCLTVCAHLVHVNILPCASFIFPGGASRVWLL